MCVCSRSSSSSSSSRTSSSSGGVGGVSSSGSDGSGVSECTHNLRTPRLSEDSALCTERQQLLYRQSASWCTGRVQAGVQAGCK